MVIKLYKYTLHYIGIHINNISNNHNLSIYNTIILLYYIFNCIEFHIYLLNTLLHVFFSFSFSFRIFFFTRSIALDIILSSGTIASANFKSDNAYNLYYNIFYI